MEDQYDTEGVIPPDNDDRGYSAASDEDLTGPGDEDLAVTQEALAEEAEARDEILYDVPMSQMIDDPHAEEREQLNGDSLVWWSDTSLLGAFEGMSQVFDEVQTHHRHAKMLIEAGAPEDTLKSTLELNFLNAPLVLGALQLLGLWVPELRETVKQILISIPKPGEQSEQEKAAIEAAVEKIQAQQLERLQAFAEAARLEETKITDESELGLGPN